MDFNITQIKITNLYGTNTYTIPFKDNKLILVAENGSGKTTIVNIIYYFLSKQWTKLIKFNFYTIEALINDEVIVIYRSELEASFSRKNLNYLRNYSMSTRHKIQEMLKDYELNSNTIDSLDRLEYLANKYNISTKILFDIISNSEYEQIDLFSSSSKKNKLMMDNIRVDQILYLPTYRRIEQDLNTIFPAFESDFKKYRQKRDLIDKDENVSYIELVEFGMEDVVNVIDEKLRTLKEFLNYSLKNELIGTFLSKVLNKEYYEINFEEFINFDEDILSTMLSTISDDVLSKSDKDKLKIFVRNINTKYDIDPGEDRIILYFVYRLSLIYNSLKEKEEDVIQFISICNEYCKNKSFIYDNNKFTLEIKPQFNDMVDHYRESIPLKNLSSGEKQIVSLFSHIYLSNDKNFFVIIDEPELSLSVPWQKRFLTDIINNKNCTGLLAVTHSPFIISDELEKYAYSLTRFLTVDQNN